MAHSNLAEPNNKQVKVEIYYGGTSLSTPVQVIHIKSNTEEECLTHQRLKRSKRIRRPVRRSISPPPITERTEAIPSSPNLTLHGTQKHRELCIKDPARKTRSKGQHWQEIVVLTSNEALTKWMETDGHIPLARWGKKRQFATRDGFKQYFMCNVPECRVELCALYPNNSEDVRLSYNSKPHVHPETGRRKWGLPEETKKEVKRILSSGVTKPAHIEKMLQSKNLTGHNFKQLTNYLVKIKRQAETTRHVSNVPLTELSTWCVHNSLSQSATAWNSNVDKIYCIHHSVNTVNKTFFFILSSKALLKFAVQASTLHVNATHKICWHGSSALFVGVSDSRDAFFPVMFCVMSEESSENYTKLLETVTGRMSASSGREFRPTALLSDGAAALAEAAKQVIPDAVRRTCWQLARKTMRSELRRQEPDMRRTCEKDIEALQLCAGPDQFETAARLMLDKWRRLSPDSTMPDHFRRHHVDGDPSWYEGFDQTTYSTSGALLAAVNDVRNRHTLRELLPLGRFLELAVELVGEWSRGASGGWEFMPTVEARKEVVRAACELQYQEKKMVHVENAIYIPAGERVVLTVDEVADYEAKMGGEVNSFDEFVEAQTSLHKVVDRGNRTDVANIDCTCPTFFRRKVCEHVLAIGAAYNLVELPESMWKRLDGTGGKRKRGRPAGSCRKTPVLELLTLNPDDVEDVTTDFDA